MTDAGFADRVRFVKSDMTVVYKILNLQKYSGGFASLPDLNEEQVHRLIALAFQRWSEVSNFRFKAATEDEEEANITLEFEDLKAAAKNYSVSDIDSLESGTAAFTVSPIADADHQYINGTVPIVFNQGVRWIDLPSYLKDRNRPVDVISTIKTTDDLLYCADLVTVAVHEIGHALGLGHNYYDLPTLLEPVRGLLPIVVSGTKLGVMDPHMGGFGGLLGCYMWNHPLPEIDAIALARRYADGAEPAKRPAAVPEGLAIVGSSYSISNATSSTISKYVEAYCWGDQQAETVPAVAAYAMNPNTRGIGFSSLNLYVVPLNKVMNQQCVIGGGVFKSTISGLQPDLPYPAVPAEDESSSPATFLPDWQWGSQDGNIRIIARLQTYLDDHLKDGECLVYFVLRRAGDTTKRPVAINRINTRIGNATYAESSLYDALTWGVPPSGTPLRLCSARTSPGADKDQKLYAHANSFTYIWLAS